MTKGSCCAWSRGTKDSQKKLDWSKRDKLDICCKPHACYHRENKPNKGVAAMKRTNDSQVYKLVVTALMAALCYVAFTFLKIPIPTFGGDYVALHIGNAFCVLAALLLGGGYGGRGGSPGDDHRGSLRSGLYHQRPQDLYAEALHRADRRLRRPSGGPYLRRTTIPTYILNWTVLSASVSVSGI